MLHSYPASLRLADKVAQLLGQNPDDCDSDELAILANVIQNDGALSALKFYRTLPSRD
jgi:hypothetical protein